MSKVNGFFIKNMKKKVFCGQEKFSFKIVILTLWSSFIVKALGRPQRTFLFNVPLITNICLFLFTAKKDVSLFYFKIPLVSHIFL